MTANDLRSQLAGAFRCCQWYWLWNMLGKKVVHRKMATSWGEVDVTRDLTFLEISILEAIMLWEDHFQNRSVHF